jgi:hypothetical protein
MWFAFNERKEYRCMDATPSLKTNMHLDLNLKLRNNTFISKYYRQGL